MQQDENTVIQSPAPTASLAKGLGVDHAIHPWYVEADIVTTISREEL